LGFQQGLTEGAGVGLLFGVAEGMYDDVQGLVT